MSFSIDVTHIPGARYAVFDMFQRANMFRKNPDDFYVGGILFDTKSLEEKDNLIIVHLEPEYEKNIDFYEKYGLCLCITSYHEKPVRIKRL
jgi:hypothetical protein